MKHDAIRYQGIPESYISEIGSFRYNTLANFIFSDKETFFKRHGLNPEKKTIFFGGSRDDFHYFEMLDIFESQLTQHNCQLILRIMPNKELMESPQIRTLIAHGRNTKGVFVSIGSPHYAADEAVGDPLTIEEYELWHGLRYCDVVVNLYSTLALEGCIFDKPVIHMWYFRSRGKLTLRQPIYVPYNQEAHIRRFREFGCSDEVFSREELVESIFNQLENPIRQKDARQRLVEKECGDLSGNAYSNFVNVCLDALGLE